MALIIRQPTANETPDATLGGNAVTGISNTGHASTTATGANPSNETKSARWFTFQNMSGVKISITLKITHTSSGTLAGPSPQNQFLLEYSLNGGGAWNTAVSRTDFTASQGPTVFSQALSASQDISQVQVRSRLVGIGAGDPADVATATATIADIQLEVRTQDAQMIVMM